MSDLSSARVNDIEHHLRSRGLDPTKTQVIMDKEAGVATFLLYNLSGQLVGTHKYNPVGDKKVHNSEELGKYFSHITKESEKTPKLAVWGIETITQDNANLFVTEGIFDAVKLHNAGFPAIAVLTNNPKILQSWFVALNKKTISIADNDAAGKKLGELTDESYSVPENFKDLGDMTQEQVNSFLTDIGYAPQQKTTSASSVDVRPVTDGELPQIKDYMLNHHYIRGWPRSVQAVLGVYVDGELSGGLLYGIGTRGQATSEIFQNEDGTPVMGNNQMWELQRAFTTDAAKQKVKNLGSMVISRGNEYIRQHAKTKDGKPVKAVISYADSVAGHKGSVYQSTNALYLGEQPPLPFYVVTNPKTGKYIRKSQLTKSAHKILTDKGLTIEKKRPDTGKHKFIYALGKDQRERDLLVAKIARPLYSYPKDGVQPQQIPNLAKQKAVQQKPMGTQNTDNKHTIIKKLLNSKVKNPETGNDILVKTALKYDKSHPSYKQAMGMTQAYARKYGIKLRPR